MKRCVIVSAGPIENYSALGFQYKEGDLVIAADGGLRHAKAMGLAPQIVIGDMDSLKGQEPPAGAELFPVRKDDTDTMLAIKKGIQLGYQDFILLGALGGRLDHTFANFQALAYLLENGCQGEIIGESQRVTMIRDSSLEIFTPYHYLSVFSYSDRCEGVSEQGVEYPLENAILTSGFPLGVSNRQKGEKAVVSVKKGTLLIILTDEK